MAAWTMVIDVSRCVGCRACMEACVQENGAPVDYGAEDAGAQLLRWVKGEQEYYNLRVLDVSTGGWLRDVPVPCMHCEDAPCVEACPTGATTKRPDGIVVVDSERCIGCKACVAVCPYGSRYVRKVGVEGAPAGTVGKCEFCVHLVEAGQQPACAEACPTGAILFGDLDDPTSEVSRKLKSTDPRQVTVLRPELRTAPSVYYVDL